jgi:hypothetical protein
MTGVQIKNGFLDLAKTDFECPNCNAKYSDGDDKYLKQCERNKSWTTRINCKCGKSFVMTYDYRGYAVSFV